jgi:formylmethanofuran dehydrogenase subunit E
MSLDGSLPPGVEQRDIDLALDGAECEVCGRRVIVDELRDEFGEWVCKQCRKDQEP